MRENRRKFNCTGLCISNKHYMVNLDSRLEQIRSLVDAGEYFTINRARQYGKTTILNALADYLASEYLVISLDFQLLSASSFQNENIFARTFTDYFLKEFLRLSGKQTESNNEGLKKLQTAVRTKDDTFMLYDLFSNLTDVCSSVTKPVVLMIDEVDSAANNQVFMDFLAQLRYYYLVRNRKDITTFQSVILAGVYDVKNLRRKLRPEEEHKTNSPWNTREGNEPDECLHPSGDCPWDQMVLVPFDIAADFNINMSFSTSEIAGMLKEYERDWHTGMDICEMAGLIFDYTSGYPFLVSRLCKLIDESIAKNEKYSDKKLAWTRDGFLEALKILMDENNTLFQSLIGKLNDYPELKEVLYALLLQGKSIAYNPDNDTIAMAVMFGFVKICDSTVVVANRIFETRLYNYFLMSFVSQKSAIYLAASQEKPQFIQDGHLNMELILERFVIHFNDLYGDQSQTFYEDDGRRYFLLYLKPIINGTGNYYIEAQTRNMERTDIIVDYGGEQFVIETKIWRGNAYHVRGEHQLSDYLDHYHLKKGYMLSFNFNRHKKIGVHEIRIGDKILIEAVV